jgi:hypothetical protein
VFFGSSGKFNQQQANKQQVARTTHGAEAVNAKTTIPMIGSTALLVFACGVLTVLNLPPAGAVDAAPNPIPMTPTDYNERDNWLCWPGRSPDACAVDLSTTVIGADGKTSVEPFKPNLKPPVDCFYVYPTVSIDPGVLATLTIEREERGVVLQQLARFGSRCRIFAPLYRQITLTALVAGMNGHPLPGSTDPAVREVGYNDVKAAWDYYLSRENHGRGVVIIGHSQGSGVLTRLI